MSGGWTKEPDGVWRNPRYPKGGARQKEGVNLVYDAGTNGARLSVDGREVALTFGELGFLIQQASGVNREVQTENARLWKEKEQIMWDEDGIEPAVYVRGVRQNKQAGRRNR